MKTLAKMIRTVLALPAFIFSIGFLPSIGCSQDTITTHEISLAPLPDVHVIKYTQYFSGIPDSFQIVGIQNGYSIYKTSGGEFFTVNPKTGTVVYFTRGKHMTVKLENAKKTAKATTIFFDPNKVPKENPVMVRILGVDLEGNVIQRNSAGKRFYLDPATGEMKYIKEKDED